MKEILILRPQYVNLLGDVITALLLSKIHGWYLADSRGRSRLRIWKQNAFWIAKSYSDWGNETGLTERRLRRALKVLLDQGLIETMISKFQGIPTLHLRYTLIPNGEPIPVGDDWWQLPWFDGVREKMLSDRPHIGIYDEGVDGELIRANRQEPFVQIVGADPDDTSEPTRRFSSPDSDKTSESLTKITTKETQRKHKGDIKVPVADAPGPQPPTKGEQHPGEEIENLWKQVGIFPSGVTTIDNTVQENNAMKRPIVPKGKTLESSEDILEGLRTKKEGRSITTKTSLQFLWMETVAQHYDVGIQDAWTQPRIKCGERITNLWGKESTRDIIQYVVAHWNRFTTYAETHSGAFKSPATPRFDYFYQHRDAAYTFWDKKVAGELLLAQHSQRRVIKLGGKKEAVPEPVQLIAPAPTPPLPPKEEPATLEEVEEIMKNLGL